MQEIGSFDLRLVEVNLQACDATDGTVTAKLLEDDSEVDSATHPIKVRAEC